MKRALPTANVRTTVRLLLGVERLPDGATGALVFGSEDEPWGTLLVEQKRVCWAAASGMETRLTDILRHQTSPPLPEELIEEVYERCRKDGTPLGAALVSRGVVTPRGLRAALRQHTGEAIAILSRTLADKSGISPKWHPNRASRYDAQFTFTPAELLVAAGSLGKDDLSDRTREELERDMDDVSFGVAFSEGDLATEALPVAQVNGDRIGIEPLVGIGLWARRALATAARCDAGRNFVAVTNRHYETLLAWMRGAIVYAAMCEERSSVSIVMARRVRGRQSSRNAAD